MFLTATPVESKRRRRVALGGFLLLVVFATIASLALTGRLESPGLPVAAAFQTGTTPVVEGSYHAALPNPFAVAFAVLENAALHVITTLITNVLSGCWWPYGITVDGLSMSLARSPGCNAEGGQASVRRAEPAVRRLGGTQPGTSVVSSVE